LQLCKHQRLKAECKDCANSPAPNRFLLLSESSSDVDSDDADQDEDDIGNEKDEINVAATSASPFLALEVEIQALVAKLRQNPLLPTGFDADSGERERGVCCGFCDAVGPSDEWRQAHVGVNDTRRLLANSGIFSPRFRAS
jgi:hypothetical protein